MLEERTDSLIEELRSDAQLASVFRNTLSKKVEKAMLELNPITSVLGHGVVVDGGNELFVLSLSDANSVYGVMKKISTED